MKKIDTYITEKLKLNRDSDGYEYHPNNKDELSSIIEKLLEERGPDADLNDIDVSKITDMKGLFADLDLINVDVSEWNVSNVTNMERMFYGCKKFNGDLSEWDVSNVENMESMFAECNKFNSDVSKWDVSKCKNMFAMFFACYEFDCDIENWNIDDHAVILNMLSFTKLKKVKCPSWY